MLDYKFIGFEYQNSAYKEYLPCSKQTTTKEQQRSLFLSMFNFYMHEDLRFQKSEFDLKKTLLNNFVCKIESLIPISFIYKKRGIKSFKFDLISTTIINNFLSTSTIQKGRFLTKHCKPNRRFFSKTPTLLIAKWIELIYKNSHTQILFSLSDMFSNLVYERIKKVNRGKKVIVLKDGISIVGCGKDKTSTFVVPCFSVFDIDKIHTSNQINIAKEELKEKKHNQIYIVYPKTEEFKKHIELKLPELNINEDDYRVKVIPYSFSFCLKNQNKGRCL